jgi:hydroxymethylbilane synthase
MRIKIGTRGSELALWQANWVKNALEERNPYLTAEIEIIKTQGDQMTDVPLSKIGGKGLFVKEIEEALLQGDIDVAVHSMKDMPSELPKGLCIAAIPRREDPRDAFIGKTAQTLQTLPKFASVGTSSLRRSAQVLRQRPDLTIVPLRGNISTRLRKLDTDSLDAIILAAAGLARLEQEDVITEYLSEMVILPAVGQGALCVEARCDDEDVFPILQELDDPHTRYCITAERAFLRTLEGGCQVPIGGHAVIHRDTLTLTGVVCSLDGREEVREVISGQLEEGEQLGITLAQTLLKQGAKKILDTVYKNQPL